MMKKNMRYIVTLGLIIGISTLLNACGEKKIVTTDSVQPYTEITEGLEIDWEQVRENFDEIVADTYPDISSYTDFEVMEDQKIIRLIWPLKNTATQLDAIYAGPGYIKLFNDVVATQDFSIAKSSENYYGGLWDKYTLQLEIFREKDIRFNSDQYYVNQEMDPGSNDPVIPQIISNPGEEASIDSTIESITESE